MTRINKILFVIFSAAGFLALGAFFYVLIHSYSYKWGLETGWNLAVRQCNKSWVNCVPMGQKK